MMDDKANADIRKMLNDTGISISQLERYLGYSRTHLNRILRYELPEYKKEFLSEAIKEMADGKQEHIKKPVFVKDWVSRGYRNPDNSVSDFGKTIKRILNQRNILYGDFAAKIGMSRYSFANLVNYAVDPRISTLLKIADGLNVSLDELIERNK